MNGQGWFVDANKGLVHTSEVGITPESMGRRAARPPITGPTTSYRQPLRRIGNSSPNPGLWNGIKAWWTGLKPEYRYGIVGGLGLVGVIIAAVQGKGKGSSSVKKI